MESQPQNPEFRKNPENFHPCSYSLVSHLLCIRIVTVSMRFFLTSECLKTNLIFWLIFTCVYTYWMSIIITCAGSTKFTLSAQWERSSSVVECLN